MNLNSQPQDIQKKIKACLSQIETLNSTELLEYSKGLKSLKEDIGEEVTNYIFKAIDLRRISINSGFDKKLECEHQKMIKDFIRSSK